VAITRVSYMRVLNLATTLSARMATTGQSCQPKLA